MKPKKHFIIWLLGFLLLDCYANSISWILQNYPNSEIAVFFMNHIYSWLLFWLVFFLLAFLIARYLVEVKGLRSFGLTLQEDWGKDLLMGFLLGFGTWFLKNLVYYQMGMFEVSAMAELPDIFKIVILGFIASFFPGIMNDITIRGFWYRYFKQLRFMGLFLVFSTMVYAMEDIWNEGFSWTNTIFSLLLGLAMAYSVVKTGAIWMSIGIHTGSNLVYRLMYGHDGQGIFLIENSDDGMIYTYINLAFTASLIPLVYLLLKDRKGDVIKNQENQYKPI